MPGAETFRRITPSSGGNSNFFFLLGEAEVKVFRSFLLWLIKISKGCHVVCLQAKRAVQRGATAVIFDVSENPDAIDQVCAPKTDSHVIETLVFK